MTDDGISIPAEHLRRYTRVRTSTFIALALLATACRERSSAYQLEPASDDDRPGPRIVTVPYKVAKLAPSPPAPVAYTVVRSDVEALQSWSELRQGAMPRTVVDRIEERRLYPLIDVMQGLKYVTVSDGVSQGNYAKVMEPTPEGRQALGAHLSEEGERFVVTLAGREFVEGSERWSWAPNRKDRFSVDFQWRWKPLNAVGERLTMGTPQSFRNELPGRAWYQQTADGWQVDDVWLSTDTRDYMGRVTR
jgi:DNA-binding PadR family transcriptional regulator